MSDPDAQNSDLFKVDRVDEIDILETCKGVH